MARHAPKKHSQNAKVLWGGLIVEVGKRMPMIPAQGTAGLISRVPISLKVAHVTIPSQSAMGQCEEIETIGIFAASGSTIQRLLVAEGESVPGPVLEIGNTNSRYKFGSGARRFVNDWNAQGPAHHCAVGVGCLAGRIEKLGRLLGIETVRVC
jgi:hypothetical protein